VTAGRLNAIGKMNLQRCLKILELETTCSVQEAKQAYKDLVRVWHPDRFQKYPRLKDKADKKLREIKRDESKNKFEIHLDSGSIIMTETWWEENDMIMYKVDGGSMGIERSRVKKIVKR
jgi:hypothetical protein